MALRCGSRSTTRTRPARQGLDAAARGGGGLRRDQRADEAGTGAHDEHRRHRQGGEGDLVGRLDETGGGEEAGEGGRGWRGGRVGHGRVSCARPVTPRITATPDFSTRFLRPSLRLTDSVT